MGKHVPECKTCGKDGERNDRYDAYFCLGCNVWLESTCSDFSCEFCGSRPASPPAKKDVDNAKAG